MEPVERNRAKSGSFLFHVQEKFYPTACLLWGIVTQDIFKCGSCPIKSLTKDSGGISGTVQLTNLRKIYTCLIIG